MTLFAVKFLKRTAHFETGLQKLFRSQQANSEFSSIDMFLAVLCLSVASVPGVCIEVAIGAMQEGVSCANTGAPYSVTLTEENLSTYDFADVNTMPDLTQIIVTTMGKAGLDWQRFNPITRQRVNLTIQLPQGKLEFNWASIGSKFSFIELYTPPVEIPVSTLSVDGLVFLGGAWTSPVTGQLQLATIPCLVFTSVGTFSAVAGKLKGLQKVVFNLESAIDTFTFNKENGLQLGQDTTIANGVIAGQLVVDNPNDTTGTGDAVTITGPSDGWSLTVITFATTVNVQDLSGTGSVRVISVGSTATYTISGENVPMAIETTGTVEINPGTGNSLTFSQPIVCTGTDLNLQTTATTVTITSLQMTSGGPQTFSVTGPPAPATLLADTVTVTSAVIASEATVEGVANLNSVDLKAGGSLTTSATITAVTMEYQYTTTVPGYLIKLPKKPQSPPKVSMVNGGKASPNGYLHPLYLFVLEDQTVLLDTKWVDACKVDDNFEIYQGNWTVKNSQTGQITDGPYSAIIAVPPPPDSDLKLTPGAIAGIVVACVIVVVVIIVLLVYACKARPGSKQEKPPAEKTDKKEASSSSMSDI